MRLATAGECHVFDALGHHRNEAGELQRVAEALIADQHDGALGQRHAVPLGADHVGDHALRLIQTIAPFIFLPARTHLAAGEQHLADGKVRPALCGSRARTSWNSEIAVAVRRDP